MFAAARGFGVPDAPRAVGHYELRVCPQRRQSLAIGDHELQSLDRAGRGPPRGFSRGKPSRQFREPRFELAAERRADARTAQQPVVQRRVQSVRAKVRARI